MQYLQHSAKHPILPDRNTYDVLYTAVQNDILKSQMAAQTTTENSELYQQYQEQRIKQRHYAFKGAMSVAQSALSSLITTMITLYMTGNGLHIVPLIVLTMSLRSPLLAIWNLNQTFARYHIDDEINLMRPKIVYFGFQLMCLCVCGYKAYKMNLIPIEYFYGVSQNAYFNFYDYMNRGYCIMKT